ncbi:G-type lectin S-receptor serine/threonine-protein kinase [Trifolium repens]|nr:G-type lectin S-receptor serine/threonine-protein kinase [Trifolium repens]
MEILVFMIIVSYILVHSLKLTIAADSLGLSQSISNDNTLVSQSGRFKLGFFALGNANKTYLDISERHVYDLDVPLFDLPTVSAATNGFSENKKISKGGFGTVYKGKLDNDEEIAAKRLSSIPGQGMTEFFNETPSFLTIPRINC